MNSSIQDPQELFNCFYWD